MDDAGFHHEPEAALDSGVLAATARDEATTLAERARYLVGSEVGVVLDLTADVARLGISGWPLELTDDKEAVLMAWLQEVEAVVVRTTPPKLALVFGCHEVLVVPIRSPGGLVGVAAVSLPCRARRAAHVLEGMAPEWALSLEAAARRASRAQLDLRTADTTPAPPPPEEIAFAVVHSGRW